jgi:hypothetical protein
VVISWAVAAPRKRTAERIIRKLRIELLLKNGAGVLATGAGY